MSANPRILVIDDDPAFVNATKAVLEAHHYEVDTAQNGEEGLTKMKQHRPDLVLLDVMMSWVLEGVSVSREMMAQEGLRRIPIIMVTSIRSSEHQGVFPQDEYLHIDSWLDKPCSPSQLLAEVERTLARHREFEKRRLAQQ
ncbi:MAG: response regulator [Chloroflexi bacterium]|nr:response regulator [Chloroflexota bacterium]